MTDSSPEHWTVTTHSWTKTVDLAHLESMRRLVGPVGPEQLTHMVLEVLAYADDEAEDQRRVGTVAIVINVDQISVVDDGRGTDTRRNSDGDIIRKPVMATPDVRFFGHEGAPRLPDGLVRRGMSSVAAVSEELIHENRRREGAWSQTYELGVPTSALVELEHWCGTGTTVRLGRLDRQVVAALDLRALRKFTRGFARLNVTVQTN